MKYLVILILLLPSIALADENISLKYKVEWNGMNAGELKLIFKEQAQKYNSSALLTAKGFVKLISKYWSTNNVAGKILGGKYIPESYATKWRFKKENLEVKVQYADGKPIKETTNDEKELYRKNAKVPDEVKKDGLDPVTAVMTARKKIAEMARTKAAPDSEFILPVFDARRKFDVHVIYKGPQKAKINDEDKDAILVYFHREPVAGFSSGELKRFSNQDPNMEVYLDPKTFLPIHAVSKAPAGSATFILTESCINSPTCQ